MEKKVLNENVYYTIKWSKLYEYNKYSAARILPEMPGVLFLYEKRGNHLKEYFLFACWREGLRISMRDLFDPLFARYPNITESLQDKDFVYKYCVVDTCQKDLQDVMYWLIKNYKPVLNNDNYLDSQRYREIGMSEKTLSETGIK